MSDSSALVDATIGLAASTFVLALGTFWMGWQARRSASAAVEAVNLQRHEIQVFEKQLALAQQQFESAHDSARARLRVADGLNWSPDLVRGSVQYISGSESAEQVEVWVKTPQGLFVGRCPTMLPIDESSQFNALPATEADLKRLPFPEFTKAPVLQGQEHWAGVTWKSPDGKRHQARWKYHDHMIDENPTILESGELPTLEGDKL